MIYSKPQYKTQYENFIGGEWLAPTSGEYFDNISPVDGKVFTKIALHFIVTGKNLKETVVKRAVDLSAEKYCSASIMLGRAGVEITHSFEIVETA